MFLKWIDIVLGTLILVTILNACSSATPPTPTSPPKLKVRVVIDSGTENDRSFNQYTLEGARKAASSAGMDFGYFTPQSTSDYEVNIENAVADGANLVVTVGFRIADATSRAAQKHPDIKFVIVDFAYAPGAGCPETAEDCYTEEGGLANVTSLMFAEDEVGYLAGVLAGCMTKTGVIASVSGVEIPPVVRFVTGFQQGARAINPEITTLNQYIPDFNDPETGKVVAQDFINQGADIIFGVGGNTGNGGVLAAHEANLMAIGVDVDQYFTYPEVKSSLLTSASKKVDVAAEAAVRDFASGHLENGIRLATLANNGVGLAPYHDWENKIPQACKDAVQSAREAVLANPDIINQN